MKRAIDRIREMSEAYRSLADAAKPVSMGRAISSGTATKSTAQTVRVSGQGGTMKMAHLRGILR